MKRKKPAKKRVAAQDSALAAFKIAVRRAIRERVRAGLPVYVERGGKIVNLNSHKRPKTKSRRAA